MIENSTTINRPSDSGAALVTVIFLTFILLIACVALLSAVGAGTANSADVLSETKAYYAAESGLQATINVLRHAGTNGIDYKTAVLDCSTSDGTTYCLDDYLTYCTTGDCDTPRVVYANGAATYNSDVHPAYAIQLSDPDNSAASLTFSTAGTFIDSGAVEAIGSTVYIPRESASPRTVIQFTGVSSTTVNFSDPPTDPALSTFPSLGTFRVVENGGVSIPQIDFEVDFFVTSPRAVTRTIRGTIPISTTGNVAVNFQSQLYSFLGSSLELCEASTPDLDNTGSAGWCSTTSLSFGTSAISTSIYGNVGPIEPYRLKVVSTGYGPRGAKKQLEAIVQKDFFNGLASGAATTMIGTNPNFTFIPGDSSVVNYSGCDESGELCVPAFGFTDPLNLQAAETYLSQPPPHRFDGTVDPPPALLGDDIPEWQSSPSALDALVDSLRSAAQNSGRYFVQPAQQLLNPGSPDGTGITFCEGSCTVKGDGGGILVVTGKLTSKGGFSFSGLIIVTGQEGWLREGGGGGEIVGNVVIAPYNQPTYVPENLSSTFLSPKYEITGGGVSDIIYNDVSATFDGTGAISNIMAGVSEK